MMKKLLCLLISGLTVLSCVNVLTDDPYSGNLYDISIQLEYPEGYSECAREGVSVSLEDVNNLYRFSETTGEKGFVKASLPGGIYRISVSDRVDNAIFNGTLDKVKLTSHSSMSLKLVYSKAGTLVIKEIYCGGCKKYPETGDYQADQYVILHNNDTRTVYLDSLCFGTLAPYNSNSSNPWGSIQDFAPVIQAVWQFGGNGSSFPLKSGEDAVLCLRGAIDHTVQYPLSVNLNRSDYFVCYNNTYFTNTNYHPTPGDQIKSDHILNVVVKTGRANAYTFSLSSPTAIIFKAQGMTIEQFVAKAENIKDVPGSSTDRVVAVPWDWIIDGVEVFNGSASSNSKRLPNDIDAGYVSLSETFLGHSLYRQKDEELSQKQGYEVLQDSNNSGSDFVELEKATLHED